MEEHGGTYRGFWKQLGCVLSVVAILGIIAIVVLIVYMHLTGR